MIEKIMRAVKSNNKKRGRNITIGAVVGMLLSCSAVMGAEGNYLWIKNVDGKIKFSTDGDSTGTGETWEKENSYLDNSWNGKTYINNMTLFGKENGKNANGNIIGYGLRLSGDLEQMEFINNGSILGEERSSSGIYNDGGNVGSIKNNGTISGNYGDGYGVYNYSTGLGSKSIIGNLVNSGAISGCYGISNSSTVSGSSIIGSLLNIGVISSGRFGIHNVTLSLNSNIGSLLNIGIISGANFGIYNYSVGPGSSVIESLINIGIISGITGIYNFSAGSSSSIIGSLLNIGIISGESSYGIYNSSYDSSSTSTINSLINTGVIFGKTNAIINDGGTINNAVNYGLLVSKDGSVVQNENDGTTNFIKSYGLAFTVKDGKYTLDPILSGEFGEINYNTDVVIDYEKDADGKFDFNKLITEKYTIVNANFKGDLAKITGTESVVLKNGILFHDGSDTLGIKDFSSDKKYILNGITDTLEVKGTGNKLNNSVINAYKTAVNMNADSNLTLGNTVINGGLDGASPVVSMTGNNDLILKNTTVNATESSAISMAGTDSTLSIEEKSTINGDIKSTGNNNTITIKESIINGDILGATGKGNTLNLIGNRDGKRVVPYNNTMNIFHKIDGFENINIGNNVAFYESAKITDVKKINIEKDGILVLRIDSTVKDGKGHALYNIGTTVSSKGGKLLLALNGAGNTETINFGTTKLDTSMVGTEDKSIEYQEDFTIDTTSYFHSVKKVNDSTVEIVVQSDLPMFISIYEYAKLNGIYRGIISVDELGNFAVNTPENLSTFLSYLNDIYAGNPYSYSSELSRKSVGMFRDIVAESQFRPNLNNWMIYGGLTHVDGGTKDTYYGKGYYTYDIGSSDMDAETKITGAYMLGEYGVSDTLTSGVVIGGNKLKSDLSNGSKVDGSAMYLGAYAKKYIGNLKVTAGAGFQYGDYDADRIAVNRVASDSAESVMKYSDNYNDMTYDIYLNGRYSHNIGKDLFLEPYATLSYTYVDQDGANEGSKVLAIETDSKSFDYTVGKVGVNLKKVIPHEKGKSTLSAGISYTKILDGADEEHITGRFKGGSDFDILVAHKNEHSIGLNAKYALELENGVLFDIKGTYSVERDSHNGSGKNKTKGEWIAGAGMGYKF
ncbi:MAG: autotransporter domain-containing protein [Fusobacterium ulcerans]|uniref:autotransporter family protein n=1 Tax=Fusobacterium ulcerans TaxID=861 RepID=UPI003A894C87